MATKKSYVKKITTKDCGLNIEICEGILEKTGKETPVLRVWGNVKSSSGKDSQYGPYQVFGGEFAAINLSDGREARSDKMILPQVAEMLVSQALAAAQKSDPKATMPFGIDITISPNPSTKGGTKFKFGVIALKGSDQKDALDLLGEELGNLPLLPQKK